MNRYQITCRNKENQKIEEEISAIDDARAVRKYNQVRRSNKQLWDWRLWKLNLPWRAQLLAANEG